MFNHLKPANESKAFENQFNTQMKKKDQTEQIQWKIIQKDLADDNSVAVVIVDENSTLIHEANNNSICKILYSSDEFSSECEKFCGKAYQMARRAGTIVEYECYAGLNCRAVPIKKDEEIKFAAIVGRAFTTTSNYRAAAERTISGDWKKFAPNEFFENVILKGSVNDLEVVAKEIMNLGEQKKIALTGFIKDKKTAKSSNIENSEKSDKAEKLSKKADTQSDNLDKLISQFHSVNNQKNTGATDFGHINNEEIEELAAWRSLFGTLFNLSYSYACRLILDFIATRYALESLAWVERSGQRLTTVLSRGSLLEQPIKINLSADSELLKEALRRESSVKLQAAAKAGEEVALRQRIRLFPVAVGGEIRSGLIVGDQSVSKKVQHQITRFCQNIASELEILRLREELERRGWLEQAVRRFNENLSEIDSEDFWFRLTQIFAELMRAERSSLLMLDEKEDKLVFKAAIGSNADAIESEKDELGERVARRVLDSGQPTVIEDVDKTGLKAAPPERNYKSGSFINYPLSIGRRKIGVLNLTDKTDGEPYSEVDLQLLKSIMPQLAVLVDRARYKHQAVEFEQLSVTDALTGLLNRRYLEERLAEEIKRSNRYGFPMSFMMIDVDDFKSYNDNFSHPEGDEALKLVAHCLKETLRGADVAARYGGEEFSILLPQTTVDEAKTIAERVRENVEKTKFNKRRITVSIGIASCSQVICNAPEIIAAADQALYRAKEMGRNNVQSFEDVENV